jgi:hypothetical protein
MRTIYAILAHPLFINFLILAKRFLVACLAFFWEHSEKSMDDQERRKLAEELKKASPEVIDEIIREAESFLGEQLKAALAADARAMNFAVILAAIVAALVGGTASLLANKIDLWPHILSVIISVAFFAIALVFAVQAARPTTFCYVGSNPKHWLPDIRKGLSLQQSKAEQASFYSLNIWENSQCLTVCQRYLRLALSMATIGALALVLLETFFGINSIAKNGLPTIL